VEFDKNNLVADDNILQSNEISGQKIEVEYSRREANEINN
jgi:hypothetical protein